MQDQARLDRVPVDWGFRRAVTVLLDITVARMAVRGGKRLVITAYTWTP